MMQSDDGEAAFDEKEFRKKKVRKQGMYGAGMENVIVPYILSFFSDLWYDVPVNEKMEYRTEQ